MSSSWVNDTAKTLPLVILGLAGAYLAYQATVSSSKAVKTTPPSKDVKNPNSTDSTDSTTPKPQEYQEPLLFKDPDTGEYLIFENGSEVPRVISVDEIFELTGSRPIEDESSNMPTEPVEQPALQDPAQEQQEQAQQRELEQEEPDHEQEPVPQPQPEEDHEEVQLTPVVDQVEEPVQQPEVVAQPVPADRVIGIEDFEDIADEQVDIDLEMANQRLGQNEPNVGGGPGPATAGNANNNNNNRVVGTKKALSIERKDQRRAFSEHQRMQALVDKQDEEEYQRKFGSIIEAEREARRFLEEEADRERKELLRKQREAEEALKREKEEVRRNLDSLQPGCAVQLATDLEKELAQTLASSTNISNPLSAPFVVGDDGNWMVKFSEEDLEELAKSINEKGSMSYAELAESLTSMKQK